MENKLKEILAILETDLKDIDSAVKHISKSKEAAQNVVDSNSKFSTSFKKSFDELHLQLQTVKSSFQDSTANVKDQWEQLTSELKQLSFKLREYIEYLDSVNIPKRLDNIENSIESFKTDLQSSREQIISIENIIKTNHTQISQELSEKLEIGNKKISSDLNKIERLLLDRFAFTHNLVGTLAKKQKINRVLLVLVGLLLVISLVISLIKP